MTENERRLNCKDLSSYKGHEAGMAALIPGIHNLSTVGSKPTCRAGKALVASSMHILSPSQGQVNPEGLMKSFDSKREGGAIRKC